MVGDFGNRTCRAPAGQAALDTLVAAARPRGRRCRHPHRQRPIVNAVTLPGGHVLVFDGLLQQAQSADEVAGVIAHELGHVEHRDVLASLIRQLGLSVVLGGVGGNVGGWANTLLAAGYSREAEGAADGYAIEALRDAHISPAPTAAFFTRLARLEPRLPRGEVVMGYLGTHPMSRARSARFAASARPGAGDAPVLDAATVAGPAPDLQGRPGGVEDRAEAVTPFRAAPHAARRRR